MSRYTRNFVMTALIESVYGTDATPTGTNAMLVSKPQITPLSAQNVVRDVMLGYLGQKEQLVGTRFVQCQFDVECVGGGAAGTRPAFGDLLLGVGLAETVTASTRVDYTPISIAFQSITLYWYDDGLLHKLKGVRGDVSYKGVIGGVPVLSFTFKGLYSTPSAASNVTPTLTGFKVPEVVTPSFTGSLTLGGTHSSTGAPAIAAGTTYPSQGLEFALGNTVDYIPVLGGESVEITQRAASTKFSLDLTAAQEVTLMGNVEAGTLQTVGLTHDTRAGYKSLIWLPSVQLINPSKADVSGKRFVAFDGRAVPTSGNDEFRLVFY